MKICVVGANGSIGKRHSNILKKMQKSATIVLCDTSDDFVDWELVRLEEFDVVAICVPTSLHIKIAKEFVNSKSFFIEKPLDSDINVVQENLDFFKNKKTMVACNMMFSWHMERIKEFLPKSLFATIKAHTFLPKWRENFKDLYSSKKELGGGCINDYAPHDLNYVVQILGLPQKMKILTKRLSNITIDTEDYFLAILEYPNRIVNVECSYLSDNKERYCDMTLENGRRIFVDFSDNLNLPFQQTISDIDSSYVRQWEHFFANEKPINSYEEAFNFMKILNESTT